jgi:hypothetical protein
MLKKVLGVTVGVITAAMLLFAPAKAFCSDSSYPTKTAGIFVNPLGIAFGVFGAEFDYAVAEKLTLNISGSFYKTGNTTAFGGGVGAQWFPLEKAFHRFWIMPRVDFAAATAEEQGISASAKLLAVGGLLGWQWTWDGGFSIRLGGGAMYYTALAEDEDKTVEVGLKGVLPSLDFSIGYTF